MGRNKQPKIFIVEDASNNHALFRTAFEQAGFEVFIRSTADGAFVEEVILHSPDIISMDLMIGQAGLIVERDGFQAIELLQANVETRDIPVIIMTNFFEESKVERAKALGVADFVTLQGQSISQVPEIFKRYLDDPKHFVPTHPLLRE